jgi:iron complex outermembrane recepter protein
LAIIESQSKFPLQNIIKTAHKTTNMRPLILALPAIVLSLSGYTTNAQTGVIRGNIITSDGKPAEQVNVMLKEIKSGTTSSAAGQYLFSHIKTGTYTLIVSYTGLQTQRKQITVNDGDTATVDITLAENRSELEEVIIVGAKAMNEKTSSLGKSAIKAIDLPQSTIVIGKQILERQQALRISDVLQNVSGVYLVSTTGGAVQEIGGRGFSYGSSNTFKNGIRFNNNAMPEISSLERIEFLKGSNAILYGNVTAGGAINLITKKPKFENGGEISFRAGSYDFYKPYFDIYGSANSTRTIAYRFNSSYEKAGSFRDKVKADRIDFNPSLLFKIGKKIEILTEGEYLKDNRTADYGTGAINYTVANIPRNSLLSVPWGYINTEQGSATLTVTHHINDNWELKSTSGLQQYKNEIFSTTRPNNTYFVQANGSWIRGLQKSAANEKYYMTELDLTGKLKTGKIIHTVLLGADADKYRTVTTAFVTNTFNNSGGNASLLNKNIYDTVNIFDPSAFNKRNDIPYLPVDRVTTTPISRFGVYAQDLVSLSTQLKLLAGIRFSKQNNQRARVDSVSKNNTGYIAAYKTSAFNPRLGIVYQPAKTVSIFASYASSFNVNSGVDINNVPLKPSIVNQVEAGIKTQLLKNFLNTNLTVYKIVNSDFAQTATNPPAGSPAGAKELAGEVTSKGVELDVMSKSYKGFSLIAGYSYNDTRYTKSNTYIKGSRLVYNPAHTANVSLYYAFKENSIVRGLNLGAGAFYTGERVAGRSTTIVNPGYKLMPLPDFITINISAGYAINNFSIRCKVNNLFNVLSYYVHDDNSVNPIAPREFACTATIKF